MKHVQLLISSALVFILNIGGASADCMNDCAVQCGFTSGPIQFQQCMAACMDRCDECGYACHRPMSGESSPHQQSGDLANLTEGLENFTFKMYSTQRQDGELIAYLQSLQ